MSFEQIIGQHSILNRTETETEKGDIVAWAEADTSPNNLDIDDQNRRFGGRRLTAQEHSDMIHSEAPIQYKNLKQSLRHIPSASEPIIAYFNEGMDKPRVIHGNRRTHAAREVGLQKVRVLIALNISEEVFKFLRDNPESNPSKVFHTPYAKARVIFNELAGRDEEDRENKIAELCKRNGMSKRQVLTAERRSKLMDEICEQIAIDPESRSSQFKTFESCDQLNEIEFYKLRTLGDFERLDKLYPLMFQYVKNKFAHDDMKEVVSFLANAEPTHHLVKKIMMTDIATMSTDELRELPAQIRLEKIKKDSPDVELEKSLEKEWRRAFELQDKGVVLRMKDLLTANVEKFNNLAESMA